MGAETKCGCAEGESTSSVNVSTHQAFPRSHTKMKCNAMLYSRPRFCPCGGCPNWDRKESLGYITMIAWQVMRSRNPGDALHTYIQKILLKNGLGVCTSNPPTPIPSVRL